MTKRNVIPFPGDLLKDLREICDDLDNVYDSYESLRVLTAGSFVESKECSMLIRSMNFHFKIVLSDLDRFYKLSRGS